MKGEEQVMKTVRRKFTKEVPEETLNVKGFFRIQLKEDGKVVGDSGWQENLVVNLGFSQYLVDPLGGTSKQISRMMLGSGGDPSATDTGIAGEFNTATYTRTTVTFANVGSKTARFTATWASANSHITASTTL